MTVVELETLGRQMWALSQSPQSDPVLKSLTYLVWQLIDDQSKNPGDINAHDMLMRMLREVHNAIAQRRRAGQSAETVATAGPTRCTKGAAEIA